MCGILASNSAFETSWFAASMNSSMSWWLSLYSIFSILSAYPFLSQKILNSGISRSRLPAFMRRFRIWEAIFHSPRTVSRNSASSARESSESALPENAVS